MSLFDDYIDWETPDGRLRARRAAEYKGLKGQPRIQLVDNVGRVYHYDAALIFPKARSRK